MKLPFAEDVNYYKTGKTPAAQIMEQVRRMIVDAGGDVNFLGEGKDPLTGNQAYVIDFTLQFDRFRLLWPVLNPLYDSDAAKTEAARRRQAATFIKHDVKANLMKAKVLGARRAFAGALVLPNGKTVGSAIDEDPVSVARMLGQSEPEATIYLPATHD